ATVVPSASRKRHVPVTVTWLAFDGSPMVTRICGGSRSHMSADHDARRDWRRRPWGWPARQGTRATDNCPDRTGRTGHPHRPSTGQPAGHSRYTGRSRGEPAALGPVLADAADAHQRAATGLAGLRTTLALPHDIHHAVLNVLGDRHIVRDPLVGLRGDRDAQGPFRALGADLCAVGQCDDPAKTLPAASGTAAVVLVVLDLRDHLRHASSVAQLASRRNMRRPRTSG